MAIYIYFLTVLSISFVFYQKKSIFLLIWPYMIYGLGPYLSLALQDLPGLESYVWPKYIDEQTFWMSLFVILIVFSDVILNFSSNIDKHVFNDIFLKKISNSKYVSFFFVFIMILSALIQLYAIYIYGSVGGVTYLIDKVPFWGLIAGFYEICFLGFLIYVFYGGKYSKLVLSVFFGSLIIRILSGTRLMAIKAAVLLLFWLYKNNKVGIAKILLSIIVLLGISSFIGTIRLGSSEGGFFDAIFFESAFNALTYNAAFYVSRNLPIGFDILIDYSCYLFLSIIPGFILNLFVDSNDLIQSFAPENQGTEIGYDVTGAWALSLFATFSYLSNYIILPISAFVALLILLFKTKFLAWFKSFLIFSLLASSLNLWRDPTGITLKLVVQNLIVFSFLLFLVSKLIKFKRVKHSVLT